MPRKLADYIKNSQDDYRKKQVQRLSKLSNERRAEMEKKRPHSQLIKDVQAVVANKNLKDRKMIEANAAQPISAGAAKLGGLLYKGGKWILDRINATEKEREKNDPNWRGRMKELQTMRRKKRKMGKK